MKPTDKEIARFWKKVDFTEIAPGERWTPESDGCWTWTAARADAGYGLTYIGGRQERAHRVTWQLFNGPIPAGLNVCHRCDNPPCVRPDHLFLGTQRDNIRDMVSKGRCRAGRHGRHLTGPAHQWYGQDQSGEANHYARLTRANVADIRAMGLAGWRDIEIAARFGVHAATIGYILRGQTWKGIEPSAPLPPVERLSYRPKLDADKAREIRNGYTGKRGDLTRLAELFGVSRPTVRAILDGRSYPEA